MVGTGVIIGLAVGGYLAIDFARAFFVAKDASVQAFKHFPENEKDKWRHGYVGCELGKALVTPITAEAYAYGYEFYAHQVKNTPISVPDAEAVMCGFWNAQNGTHWEWVPTKVGACTINVLQLITVPCVTICKSLKAKWDYFDSLKDTDDSSDHIGDGYSINRVVQENSEVIKKILTMAISESNQIEMNKIGIRQVEENLTEEDKKSLDNIAKANKKITKEKIKEIISESEEEVKVVKYLLNTNKKEIHNLNNLTYLCNIGQMKSDHKRYLNHERRARGIISLGYDGCKHCMPELHTK